VIEDGVSAFILAGDDPPLIEVWGGEVAPAVREAVASERRAAGTVTTRRRNAARGLSIRD
jgi:hypothetical protein